MYVWLFFWNPYFWYSCICTQVVLECKSNSAVILSHNFQLFHIYCECPGCPYGVLEDAFSRNLVILFFGKSNIVYQLCMKLTPQLNRRAIKIWGSISNIGCWQNISSILITKYFKKYCVFKIIMSLLTEPI